VSPQGQWASEATRPDPQFEDRAARREFYEEVQGVPVGRGGGIPFVVDIGELVAVLIESAVGD
jgi:hypothetical protein